MAKFLKRRDMQSTKLICCGATLMFLLAAVMNWQRNTKDTLEKTSMLAAQIAADRSRMVNAKRDIAPSRRIKEQLEAMLVGWETKPMEERASLMAHFARSLTIDELAELLSDSQSKFIKELPGDVRSFLVRKMTKLEPALAGESFKIIDDPDERKSVGLSIIRQWSAKNWNDAMGWAQNLPEDSAKTEILWHLVGESREKSLEEAGGIVLGLSPGTMRAQLLERLIGKWQQTDFDSAWTWVQRVPEGKERDLVFLNLALGASFSDGKEQALSTLASHLSQQSLGQPSWIEAEPQAAISIISAWSRVDPAAAANWAVHFPAGELSEYALENVMMAWSEQDAKGAAWWLTQLPEGPNRDAAINGFSGGIWEREPELAVRWAESIGKQEVRLRQVERAARQWLALEPARAHDWIIETDLPEPIKQRLLQ